MIFKIRLFNILAMRKKIIKAKVLNVNKLKKRRPELLVLEEILFKILRFHKNEVVSLTLKKNIKS